MISDVRRGDIVFTENETSGQSPGKICIGVSPQGGPVVSSKSVRVSADSKSLRRNSVDEQGSVARRSVKFFSTSNNLFFGCVHPVNNFFDSKNK